MEIQKVKTVIKVKLNIFQFAPTIAEAFDELADEYMKENPDINVSVETSNEKTNLRARMASGDQPVIFIVEGPQDMENWADKLVDLTDLEVTKKAFPSTLKPVTRDNKVYGLPHSLSGFGFIYNKEMFKKAGIDASVINTYDALEDAVIILDSKKEELGLDAVFAVAGKETWIAGTHLTSMAIGQEFTDVVKTYNAKELDFTYSDGMKAVFDLELKYAVPNSNAITFFHADRKTLCSGKNCNNTKWSLGI